jgi:hypothetical protein
MHFFLSPPSSFPPTDTSCSFQMSGVSVVIKSTNWVFVANKSQEIDNAKDTRKGWIAQVVTNLCSDYEPASIWSTTLLLLYQSQSTHVSGMTLGMVGMSSGRETTFIARPPDRCQATWQWKGQTPGLSASNWRAAKPPARMVWMSRRAGFCWLRMLPSHVPVPSSRMYMLWP